MLYLELQMFYEVMRLDSSQGLRDD
jgi:hypothetical protein